MEAGIEAEAALHQVVEVGEGAEDVRIGLEFDQGAVGDAGAFAGQGLDQLSADKARAGGFSVAVGLDQKRGREGVDGLGAHAVEADGELEDIVVVLGAGVDARDAIDHLAEGDAPAVVADADPGAVDVDFDAFPVAHDEFIHGVVDDLL